MNEQEKDKLLSRIAYIGQKIIINPKDGYATQEARNLAIETYVKLKRSVK